MSNIIFDRNVSIPDKLLAAVRSRFPEIKVAVNEAIEKARVTDGEWHDEPINWATVRCAYVEFVLDEDSYWYRSTISNASPYSNKLCMFVAKQLHAAGMDGFEVVAEW